MSVDFPFSGATDEAIAASSAENNLPLFTEYAWNFELDRFIYDGRGRHVVVTGKEAVKVWVYKALKTERYEHLAYSWQYGIEVKKFIGKVMQTGDRIAELKRVIIDCLMINPYIKSIDNVEIGIDGPRLVCTISMTTIYGEALVSV